MKFSLQNIFTVINTVLVVVLFYLNKRNSRISVVPYLAVDIKHSGENPIIKLANQGEVFAMDVDIWIYGYVNTENTDQIKNLQSLLIKEFTINLPAADKEGWIGISDRLTYYVFPKKKVTAPLALPSYIQQITVIVQFRDPSGVNYAQEYWFARDRDLFRLKGLEPRQLRSCMRRDYSYITNLDGYWSYWGVRGLFRIYTYQRIFYHLLTLLRPSYLDKHTHQLIKKHTLSSGYLKGFSRFSDFDGEDRGTWSEL